MKERREIHGRWWIHGKEKPACPGTLEYDPEDGLHLKVKHLESYSAEHILQKEPPGSHIIVGRDHQDKPVTVYGTVFPSTQYSPGLKSITFKPLRAIIGAELAAWTTARVSSASVRFSLLNPWLGRFPFATRQREKNQATVTHAFQPDIQVRLDSQDQITITSEFRCGPFGHGVLLEDEPFVRFAFGRLLSPAQVHTDYILPLTWLLTLFVGTPVYTDSVHFTIGETDAELLSGNAGASRADRERLSIDMRVCYKDIEKAFPQILQQWLHDYSRLNAALRCYFATVFNKTLYGNHRFLLLAQALEVYHNESARFETCRQPKTDFRNKIVALVNCVPENEREWLKEKLHYANQKTLSQRLDDILQAHPEEVAELIRDTKWFADKVRHTRNYYTHFDPDLKRKGKVATDSELVPLVDKMQSLLEICFLKELGITGLPIRRIIHRSNTSQYFTLGEEKPPHASDQNPQLSP